MPHREKRGSERRRSPRIQARHELTLRAHGGTSGHDFRAHSVDLNLGGIYCALDRFVPVFSKHEVRMTLPVSLDDANPMNAELVADAVVVRMSPAHAEHGRASYDCALAFVTLSEEAELAIARYLLAELVRH